MNMSNFTQRLLTGSVFVVALVLTIFAGRDWLTAVFALVGALAAHEAASIFRKGGFASLRPLPSAAVALVLHLIVASALNGNEPVLLLGVLPVLAVLLVSELFVFSEQSMERMITAVFTQVVFVLPFSLLGWMGTRYGNYEPWLVMGFFVLLWVNDTGAYLAGKSLGRTKLAPAISPGKTVEGFIGGVLLAFGAAWVLSVTTEYVLPLRDWMVMAACVAVFSNAGDLMESVMKRRCGVKDSGKLLPGHGGVLDRFDGVLLSVPVIVAYLQLVNR